MDNKPAQNIQDSFLNTARKERTNITIYLLSGVKLTGRIRSFDKYSVVLETNNQEQLIFKHAISTVAMVRAGHGPLDRPAPVAAATEVVSEVPRFRNGGIRRVAIKDNDVSGQCCLALVSEAPGLFRKVGVCPK